MNGYLIDHIKTTKANSPLMASYLNTVLLSLDDPEYDIEIHIKGACWNKTTLTALKHIDSITNKVERTNKCWYLYDSYRMFSAKYTKDALLTRKHMAYICTTLTPIDHSKIIAIKINGTVCFYMLGSSNFSYSTYCDKKRKIGEADIAFIKTCDITSNLIKQHISGNDPQMQLINSLLVSADLDLNGNEVRDSILTLGEITSSVSYDKNINFDEWFENDFGNVRYFE